MTRVRLRPRCRRCRPLWTSDVVPGKIRHSVCRGTGTTRFRPCPPPCSGTGWVDCPICDGTGIEIQPRQIGWGRWTHRRRTEPGRPWWRF